MKKINLKPKYEKVLIASTVPVVWEDVVTKDNIATQKRNSADADYIAFFRTRPKDNDLGESAITHIAKVKNSNNNAPTKEYFEKYPRVKKFSIDNKKGWGEKQEYHKEYRLEEIRELPRPILCRKGDGKRCQVKLYTTLEELNKANYLGDIKTISQLGEMGSATIDEVKINP